MSFWACGRCDAYGESIVRLSAQSDKEIAFLHEQIAVLQKERATIQLQLLAMADARAAQASADIEARAGRPTQLHDRTGELPILPMYQGMHEHMDAASLRMIKELDAQVPE